MEDSRNAGRPDGASPVPLKRPVVVVADLHLESSCSHSASDALAALLGRHSGAELVCAGDSFNLSVESAPQEAARRLANILRTYPTVREALRQRLVTGSPVTVLAGNHDAAIVTDPVQGALRDALEVQGDVPLTVSPWFVRRGQVHIEHGNLYDPDNAPVHPLARWSSHGEPLGVALTRRVLAPTNAQALTHAHETTPLAGLVRTLGLFGPKGLEVIARYFGVSLSLCWAAMTEREHVVELRRAEQALTGFAARSGLSPADVQSLIRAAPEPTHRHPLRTFRRLYLDRASAVAVLFGAGGAGVLAASPTALSVAAAAASYLGISCLAEGTNRYAGALESRLRSAAQTVSELTDATLVVLGHAHRGDSADRYLNPGAFGLPNADGRRYVLIGVDGSGVCLSAEDG